MAGKVGQGNPRNQNQGGGGDVFIGCKQGQIWAGGLLRVDTVVGLSVAHFGGPRNFYFVSA